MANTDDKGFEAMAEHGGPPRRQEADATPRPGPVIPGDPAEVAPEALPSATGPAAKEARDLAPGEGTGVTGAAQGRDAK